MDANSQSKTKFIFNFDGQLAKMFNKRPVYARQYPVALVQNNGSTICINYHEPMGVIHMSFYVSSTKWCARVASLSVKVDHMKQQNRTIVDDQEVDENEQEPK